MLLINAIRNGSIPQNVISLLPSYNCPRCGDFLHVSPTLTRLYCNNEICPIHMPSRMNALLKSLGVKDIAESRCEEIIRTAKLNHHSEVMFLEIDELPSQYSYTVRERWWMDINRERTLSVAEIVANFQIPDLGNIRASRVFEGVQDLNEFYNDYDTKDKLIIYITNKLNQKGGDGVLPRRIAENLLKEKEYLLKFQTKFNVRKVSKITLPVAITGEILNATDDKGFRFRPRESYIKYINDKYEGILNVVLKSSYSSDLVAVIADRPSGSSKYTKAQRDNKIITSDKFLQSLDMWVQKEIKGE